MNLIVALLLFLACIAFPLCCVGQGEENSSYRQLKMVQLGQENDLYQIWYQSDKNFTGGVEIIMFHPVFDLRLMRMILPGLKKNSLNDFSLSLSQDIFTPEMLRLSSIDSTDRPYTALLYFTYSRYSNNLLKGRKLSSRFYAGIQGREALGEEMQNGVHALINNDRAKGWEHQLGSGLMLDYELYYQALLPLVNHFFESNYFGKLHAGTIYDNASAGIMIKAGHYADTYIGGEGVVNGRNGQYFTIEDLEELSTARKQMIPASVRERSAEEQLAYLNRRMNRKFQLYFHLTLTANYTLYNGTITGSLLPFSFSPYTRHTPNPGQLILVGAYGIHLQLHRWYLSFDSFLQNEDYGNDVLFGYGRVILGYVL